MPLRTFAGCYSKQCHAELVLKVFGLPCKSRGFTLLRCDSAAAKCYLDTSKSNDPGQHVYGTTIHVDSWFPLKKCDHPLLYVSLLLKPPHYF